MKSKILTALLSGVIAFGLWLYVVTVISPESEATYYNIPVVLEGKNVLEEKGLMIVSDTDLRVSLRLFGNRADLNKLNSANITIMADLSQISEAGIHNVKYDPENLRSAGIEVLERDPQYITVVVAERVSKEIPVRISYTGSVPDSYTADVQNAVLNHTTVTVSGPREVIDRIDHARITVDLTGKTTTISGAFRHTLCGGNNLPVEDVSAVTANVSEIQTIVRIYREKTVPVIVKVIPGGGIPQEMVKVQQDIHVVTLSGSDAALEKLDQIVAGSVDLGELTESTTLDFPIVVPEGIAIVSGEKTVSVSVTMPAMETRAFEITKFETVNVPDGRIVEVQTTALEVTIRGPVDVLDRLRPEDIVAIVDCQTVEQIDGSVQLKVTIKIPAYDSVGAVGEPPTVKVLVTIPEPEDTEG